VVRLHRQSRDDNDRIEFSVRKKGRRTGPEKGTEILENRERKGRVLARENQAEPKEEIAPRLNIGGPTLF